MSCVLCVVSCVLCLVCCVLYVMSCVLCLVSSLSCLVSCVLCLVPCAVCLGSCIVCCVFCLVSCVLSNSHNHKHNVTPTVTPQPLVFGCAYVSSPPQFAFDGRSDYGPFLAVGNPAGGVFTVAGQIKTEEQAARYEGTAGIGLP